MADPSQPDDAISTKLAALELNGAPSAPPAAQHNADQPPVSAPTEAIAEPAAASSSVEDLIPLPPATSEPVKELESPAAPPAATEQDREVTPPSLDKGKGRALEDEAPAQVAEDRQEVKEEDKLPGEVVQFQQAEAPLTAKEVATAGTEPSEEPAVPAASAVGSHQPEALEPPVVPGGPQIPARKPQRQEEPEDEWPLKWISWPPLPLLPSDEELARGGQFEGFERGPEIRIILQNRNGPCSLIALANVLILRSVIVLEPSLTTVTYAYLSTLLADALMNLLAAKANPDVDDEAAVGSLFYVLPTTLKGLTLSPRFAAIDGWAPRPASDAIPYPRGELDLFARFQVPLVHGWCVDPQQTDEWEALVEQAGDYDEAAVRMAAGIELETECEEKGNWSEEAGRKIAEANLIKAFLDGSSSQLTYHGLLLLSTQPNPASLSVILHNSHLSVLYRRPELPTSLPSFGGTPPPALYTLVTDAVFRDDPTIVWESLEDVDGSACEFFDAQLRRVSGRGAARRQSEGGDWIGQQQRSRGRPQPPQQLAMTGHDGQEAGAAGGYDADLALAQQLQLEEEDRHFEQEEREERQRRDERRTHQQQPVTDEERRRIQRPPPQQHQQYPAGPPGFDEKKKKKKDCVIM